ncbi:AHH domain-containing protein [Planctomycetota bacterium]
MSQSVLNTVQDSVVNGVSVDQALKNFAFSLFTDQFGFAAIGATIGVATRALMFSGQNVVGFAKVAGGISLPGTIVQRSRLIPGNLGAIIGGKSQVLKANILAASGINRSIAARGFQAHHIIPTQLGQRSHRVLRKIGIDLDSATNGILLPNAIHTGHHPAYTKAIEEALDRIPTSASIENTMERVYEIQSKAARAFIEHGASLRGAGSSSISQWRTWLA